jgi:hypothetical protein
MKFKKLIKGICREMRELAVDHFDGSVKVKVGDVGDALVTLYDEEENEVARATVALGPEVEEQQMLRITLDKSHADHDEDDEEEEEEEGDPGEDEDDEEEDGSPDDDDNDDVLLSIGSGTPGAFLGLLMY